MKMIDRLAILALLLMIGVLGYDTGKNGLIRSNYTCLEASR